MAAPGPAWHHPGRVNRFPADAGRTSGEGWGLGTLAAVGLIEHSTQERLSREAAAERLRQLADELSRHNEVSFERDGLPFKVEVPDEVDLTLEVEVGDDGKSEIEVEITW